MPFSSSSTVGELLDNEATRGYMEKHMPELINHPMIKMARGMSLRAIAPFSGGKLDEETLAKIDVDLAKL